MADYVRIPKAAPPGNAVPLFILYRDRREFERVQGPASDSGSTLMRISREARERNYW